MPSNTKNTSPYNCPGCDLSGKSFAGKDLTNANLKGAKLLGTIFKGVSSMKGADLTGAIMGSGTDFSGVDLTDTIFGTSPNFGSDPSSLTNFSDAIIPYAVLGESWNFINLSNANILNLPKEISSFEINQCIVNGLSFEEMTLKNAHFSSSQFQNANFSNGILNNIVFSGECDLSNANFTAAIIPSGVFDTSTLTKTDFASANLSNATFLNTMMNGTQFVKTDVTSCAFSQPPLFSRNPDNITSFNGSKINISTIKKQWSYLDLRGATIIGFKPSLDLTWLQATATLLSDLDFTGATLTNANFTGATLAGTIFEKCVLTNATFNGTQATKAIFTSAIFTGAFFEKSSKRASFNGCTFDNSLFNNTHCHEAEFVKCSFIEGKFHGAVLTNTSFENSILTQAQFGKEALLFKVSGAPNYEIFLTALNTKDTSEVKRIFNTNGYPINNIAIKIPSPSQKGMVWIVQEGTNGTKFMVRKDVISQQSVLSVFNNNAQAASMNGAYMPGVTLTSANLYGVIAHGAQVYGTSSNLNSTIFDAVDFTGANLGSANLKNASLYDVIFDNAILSNTHFQGTILEAGQEGRAVSMDSANLQGAQFQDAKLFGANLNNAAICLPTEADPTKTLGVWQYEVASNDPLYKTYIDELNTAVNSFIMNIKNLPDLEPGKVTASFVTAFNKASNGEETISSGAEISVVKNLLSWEIEDSTTTYILKKGFNMNTGEAAYKVVVTSNRMALPSTFLAESAGTSFFIPLSSSQYFSSSPPIAPELIDAFKKNGNVQLSTNAVMKSFQRPVAWDIVDSSKVYSIWEGFSLSLNRELVVRPAIPNLKSLFKKFNLTLFKTKIKSVKGGWTIDNDSEDAFNTALGYVTFTVDMESSGDSLIIFGNSFRIEQLGNNNQLTFHTIVSSPTLITVNNFDDNTIFPNGKKVSISSSDQLKEVWMRASVPPNPPDCVPGFSYCPSASSKGENSLIRKNKANSQTGKEC